MFGVNNELSFFKRIHNQIQGEEKILHEIHENIIELNATIKRLKNLHNPSVEEIVELEKELKKLYDHELYLMTILRDHFKEIIISFEKSLIYINEFITHFEKKAFSGLLEEHIKKLKEQTSNYKDLFNSLYTDLNHEIHNLILKDDAFVKKFSSPNNFASLIGSELTHKLSSSLHLFKQLHHLMSHLKKEDEELIRLLSPIKALSNKSVFSEKDIHEILTRLGELAHSTSNFKESLIVFFNLFKDFYFLTNADILFVNYYEILLKKLDSFNNDTPIKERNRIMNTLSSWEAVLSSLYNSRYERKFIKGRKDLLRKFFKKLNI